MNIFEKIKHNFIQRKKEEVEREKSYFMTKITLKNRIMACLPIFDLFNIISINKRLENFSSFNSDIFFIKILSSLGTLLSFYLCSAAPGDLIPVFFLSTFFACSVFCGLIYNLNLRQKKINEIITKRILKCVLEKEDFGLLKENLSIDILTKFMAKNDFKITYEDLDYFSKEYAYKEAENKAKEIILSTTINKHSDDTIVPSKENIVVN